MEIESAGLSGAALEKYVYNDYKFEKEADMSIKLFISAMIKFLFGAAIVGALIFLPAWSMGFAQGWMLMAALFIPMFIVGIIMMIKSPDLLKKRLDAKESQKDQKIVLFLSGIMFIAAFIVAGLNYRFSWFVLPLWASIIGLVIFLSAYILYGEVLRENAYLSRTIEVQENQKVIDTGLYGVVRHPMYMATLILFFAMPIILGSLFSLAIMLMYIPLIVIRIRNEEKVLEEGLEGYKEYKRKVKYRLIPFIW